MNMRRRSAFTWCTALFLPIAIAAFGVRANNDGLIQAAIAQRRPPAGWVLSGSAAKEYEATVDSASPRGGTRTVRLRSTVEQPSGFGTIMQMISADAYRGQRVRFAGAVRVRDVRGAAALWLRADDPCGHDLVFQNTVENGASGTASWKRHVIVFDVPTQAHALAFGLLLQGGGTAWTGDLALEIVADSVAVTTAPLGEVEACRQPSDARKWPRTPLNLSFLADSL